MDTTAIDFTALGAGAATAAVITGVLAVAARGERWGRTWVAAAALAIALIAVGLVDLLRERSRETHVATVLLGVPIPVLAALGMIRATHRVRRWYRWPLVYGTAFLLLFAGLFVGAALLPRYLGG